MKKTTSIKKTLAKASNKKAVKTTNKKRSKKMTRPDFMKKFEMTPNMVIGNRDAKIWVHGTIQAIEAKSAVKEVKAVKAVKEVKAVPEKIVNDKVQPAIKAVAPVKAVKAVKASPAVKAVSQKWKGVAIGNTNKIVKELIARLGDQGFYPEDEGKQHGIDEVKFCAEYIMKDVKGFRKALKLCKSAGKYNNPGLEILAAKEAKEKESEKKAAKAKKEAEKKKEEKKEEKPASKKEGEEAGWPTPGK